MTTFVLTKLALFLSKKRTVTAFMSGPIKALIYGKIVAWGEKRLDCFICFWAKKLSRLKNHLSFNFSSNNWFLEKAENFYCRSSKEKSLCLFIYSFFRPEPRLLLLLSELLPPLLLSLLRLMLLLSELLLSLLLLQFLLLLIPLLWTTFLVKIGKYSYE